MEQCASKHRTREGLKENISTQMSCFHRSQLELELINICDYCRLSQLTNLAVATKAGIFNETLEHFPASFVVTKPGKPKYDLFLILNKLFLSIRTVLSSVSHT